MQLGDAYTIRVESLRDLIELYDREVVMLEAQIRGRLRGHRGYRAIQAINGIGPTMAAILVAEIGDVYAVPVRGRVVFLGRTHTQTSRSPTRPCGAAASPSKGRGWCAGR